ncbi:MAG: hypothetical protein ACK4F6_19005, partial [Hylemonella sp.]
MFSLRVARTLRLGFAAPRPVGARIVVLAAVLLAVLARGWGRGVGEDEVALQVHFAMAETHI